MVKLRQHFKVLPLTKNLHKISSIVKGASLDIDAKLLAKDY